MTTVQKDASKRWVEARQEAGEALDRVKWAELRAMTDDEARRQSRAVMEVAERWLALHPDVERPSGLVEQQRWFARWTQRPK